MQTVFPYQVRLIVTGLTNLAEELDLAGDPRWHPLARAAAGFECLLRGETPHDLTSLVDNLKAITADRVLAMPPRRPGVFSQLLLDLAINLLDAVRLGLLRIEPTLTRPAPIPHWIGIDQGTGDRTVYHGGHHA